MILQVNDLNGPQDEQTVKIGMEVPVSAVQGFGGQRKFNKWVEFSRLDRRSGLPGYRILSASVRP